MAKNLAFDKAIAAFREHNGMLGTTEAIRLGVQPRTLYAMQDSGALERIGRGRYRLSADVLLLLVMFLRCRRRGKNGKAHRYWSVVESRRLAGGKSAQRQVLYL